MTTPLRYGFGDESGSVTRFSTERYLIVAIIVIGEPRRLEHIVRRARESLGRKAKRAELKAAASDASVIRRMLRRLSEEECSLVVVAGDRDKHLSLVDEPERFYRRVVAAAVRVCVEQWPRLELVLDKHYTTTALRTELEKEIRGGLAGIADQLVVIRQEDSHNVKGLQAVDFIAWAFARKYNRGESEYVDLLNARVVTEMVW